MGKANPVSTLLTDGNYEPHGISTVHGSNAQLRKLPRSRQIQEDEYVTFKKEDTVTSLRKITNAWVKKS